jgi:spermidine synthase
MTAESKWFFEHFDSAGTAFGLRLKRKIEEVQTPWQHIEMWETDTFGYLMTIDGCTMVTSRDNFLYHEMMSHPVLLTHASPKNVVIIGGGDCGTLREVLRHPEVEKVTQIDIDEQVTRLSEKYFPELCASNSDPRAELLFIDGVKWIQEQPDASVDVLIVDSTDPVGPAAGLFHADFFRHCHRILRDGGLLVQQSESPLLHADTIIRDLHVNMKEAGFTSTATLPFPQPVYPSGWWSCTLAGKGCDTRQFREPAAALDTRYYTSGVHQGALATPPFLARALADT